MNKQKHSNTMYVATGRVATCLSSFDSTRCTHRLVNGKSRVCYTHILACSHTYCHIEVDFCHRI